MPDTLSAEDWTILLASIRRQKCIPFLGAGACCGILPLSGQVAEKWSEEYDYPLPDRNNLIRVAQYLAVDQFPMAPKFLLLEGIQNIALPKPGDEDEPHRVLAEMQLPVYMTTNYDNFMTPVVFHLHGNDMVPQSLVLTEDDYLEFLVALSRDTRIIPEPIRRAMVGSSLLFIGYSLADSTFRVLHRGLTDKYFNKLDIRVYWGTAREFARDLRRRWTQQQSLPANPAGG